LQWKQGLARFASICAGLVAAAAVARLPVSAWIAFIVGIGAAVLCWSRFVPRYNAFWRPMNDWKKYPRVAKLFDQGWTTRRP
jgi:hypothetical protein